MKNQKVSQQQVKSRPRKGWLFLFGISLLLVFALSGCEAKDDQTASSGEQTILIEEPAEKKDETSSDELSSENRESSVEISSEEGSSVPVENSFTLVVQPGEYLIRILEDLSVNLNERGHETEVSELLGLIDKIREEGDGLFFQKAEDLSMTAFSAEGYIAPGEYRFTGEETEEEILLSLLSSWDQILSANVLTEIDKQDLSFHEILTAASIIEFESSRTKDDSVKALVSSVIFNRLSSETPLQMDVTVFYLEEGLSPYRDPSDYEWIYDTYEAEALPPGPICSPSEASILAALWPADTDYYFFIYDEEGNYYFASDYETHLENVETYLGD
ncbi:MAG: endolytic transglycosylase MltG [Firmicutes bacterium]|nr:endolytic transglycosylase MltG [Bacillota bacterium]